METEIFRNNHLVDPALHIWGAEVAVYLFLGGLAGGLMVLSALGARRIGSDRQSAAFRYLPFAVPLLISVGMVALLLDLELKMHLFRFYTVFRVTSPMSWGAWLLLAIYPASILLGVTRLRDDEVERLASWRVLRPFGIARVLRAAGRFSPAGIRRLERANVVLGVALGGYTGILLGTLGARALWSSPMLGPLFLLSGISSAAAFAMLLPLNREEHGMMRGWDVAALGAEAGALALFFIGLAANGGESGRRALSQFFGGEYTALFWSLVVITGLAIPFFTEMWESRKGAAATVVTPLLILAGGFALRWIFVAAGQAV
jgi:protein NrfD